MRPSPLKLLVELGSLLHIAEHATPKLALHRALLLAKPLLPLQQPQHPSCITDHT